jgi:hypothetical protein
VSAKDYVFSAVFIGLIFLQVRGHGPAGWGRPGR